MPGGFITGAKNRPIPGFQKGFCQPHLFQNLFQTGGAAMYPLSVSTTANRVYSYSKGYFSGLDLKIIVFFSTPPTAPEIMAKLFA